MELYVEIFAEMGVDLERFVEMLIDKQEKIENFIKKVFNFYSLKVNKLHENNANFAPKLE